MRRLWCLPVIGIVVIVAASTAAIGQPVGWWNCGYPPMVSMKSRCSPDAMYDLIKQMRPHIPNHEGSFFTTNDMTVVGCDAECEAKNAVAQAQKKLDKIVTEKELFRKVDELLKECRP